MVTLHKKKVEHWKTNCEDYSDLEDLKAVKLKYREIEKSYNFEYPNKSSFIFATNIFFNNKTNKYDMLVWYKTLNK